MPKAIHCLCRNNAKQAPKAFRPIEGDIYKSGYWIVRDYSLIEALREHGWLYLHDRGGLNSWFIGVVLAAERRNIDGRWDFTVQKRGINPKPWRGELANISPFTHARVVDCTWKFELAPIVKPAQQGPLQLDPA
jgi:hypothetical protein